MGLTDTRRTLLLALTLATPGWAQPLTELEWRRIGNSAVDVSLASLATGPVERVWHSADGHTLFARTRAGRTYATSDFDRWQVVFTNTPAGSADAEVAPPEPQGRVRRAARQNGRYYAFGRHAWRSDDGGRTWSNLTAWRRESILGGGLHDLSVSPRDADEIVAAGDHGLWRSLDGGLSWYGLNDALPNLAVRRILAAPEGAGGLRIGVEAGAGLAAFEWGPGEKLAWRPAGASELEQDAAVRRSVSGRIGAPISAWVASGSYQYAGSVDGRLWTSQDQGRTWILPFAADTGAVESIWVDPSNPRAALAALARRPGGEPRPRLLRTINGGLFWDDISGDLPDSSALGVTADAAAGGIYIATELGVYFTTGDLASAGSATGWTRLEGLPAAEAVDVRLDAAANQIYVALRGWGVYTATAPHRSRQLRVVNAADLSERPAAPGSLVSVLGGRVLQARAEGLNLPVLAADESESQLQVPFEAQGALLTLTVDATRGRLRVGLPLAEVSPAVFVDREGAPMILDAETGVLLDARNTARPGSRIQILATGLGRVRPDWPTGIPAPLEDPPRVIATVRAVLDGMPLEVLRATLAPYVGFYVIEARLPEILNAGPAELYLESGGRQSNRVRISLESPLPVQ